MRLRNTGRWAWPQAGTFRLGFASMPIPQSMPFQVPADASLGQMRALLESGQRVLTAPLRTAVAVPVPGAPAPGEVTFSFPLTVPTQAPGWVLVAFGMVHEPGPGVDTTPDAMFFGQGLYQRSYVS